ncbi:uracil-DNA glycosylase [Mycetohabitans rhizoxinica]|uniref:uracil-DNA glycosylase n=1 Tax=Mycetohabitans rhizoxinica TaxID=412963 RepID=UPI0030D08B63
MTQLDAILEELGIAPLWVRRGAGHAHRLGDAEGDGLSPARDVMREAGIVLPAQALQATQVTVQACDAQERAAHAPAQASHTPVEAARSRVEATEAQGAATGPAGDGVKAAEGVKALEGVKVVEGVKAAERVEAPEGDGAVVEVPNARRALAAPVSPAETVPTGPGDARSLQAEPMGGQGKAAAPALGVAADAQPVPMLDWEALKARVAGCTLCRLCERRTNTVFGVGDETADWMLVGEAPGENEDKQGEPFVGQAGKLLDNMLRALQMRRGDNVYIANVLKCRPPGNRNPQPDEVMRCEPYLKRQVALVKPNVIVALGRFAAQSLLKTDASIASLRGRVHEYEGVPVIVTYHPAYLLRSLHDKHKAWSDLCLARAIHRKRTVAH